MTVKKFAEIVCETVGRNNQDFAVDERVVIGIAELLTSTYISELVRNGKSIPTGYYQTFTMDVINPGEGKRKYIEFDPPAMNVGNNDGYAYIGATEDETDINSNYVLLRHGQLSSAAGLEAQALGGRTAVLPEGKKGYLYNEPLLLKEVKVSIIPQLTELDEDEEMFGADEIGAFILQQCIEYIKLKRGFREDKQTDGQSN